LLGRRRQQRTRGGAAFRELSSCVRKRGLGPWGEGWEGMLESGQNQDPLGKGPRRQTRPSEKKRCDQEGNCIH